MGPFDFCDAKKPPQKNTDGTAEFDYKSGKDCNMRNMIEICQNVDAI